MIANKRGKTFKSWLLKHGCDVLPNTNEYESIRWKGRFVGVIYKTGKASNNYAANALNCFKNGKKWNGGPLSTGRKNTYRKQKAQLLERDGKLCFYCHTPLEQDITVEHLIELNKGGKNDLSNMVLAHEKCNKIVQGLTVVEKVKISINNKLKLEK